MQYSYNIIVDSPCEITADFAKANQLKVLHFTYTEGNGDEGLCGVDDLFVSRTAHEFYEAMRNGAAPQTSQPSQHEFESAFREAIESGIPAVYLAFDSGISGCYEGACMALDRLKDEYGAENVAVHIVDTKLPATPLNMLVWEAVRQREKGMPLEQMIAWATEAHNYMHIHFMVDDLKALARGGRIPSGVAVVGTKLDIKPMLTVSLDGKLELNGIAHGRKKGIRRMAENYLSCMILRWQCALSVTPIATKMLRSSKRLSTSIQRHQRSSWSLRADLPSAVMWDQASYRVASGVLIVARKHRQRSI